MSAASYSSTPFLMNRSSIPELPISKSYCNFFLRLERSMVALAQEGDRADPPSPQPETIPGKFLRNSSPRKRISTAISLKFIACPKRPLAESESKNLKNWAKIPTRMSTASPQLKCFLWQMGNRHSSSLINTLATPSFYWPLKIKIFGGIASPPHTKK